MSIETTQMDISEQLDLFYEFFDSYFLHSILEIARSDKESLMIDFSLLSKFNIGLSEHLLNHPDDTLKAIQLALSKFDLPRKITPRFFNLPRSQNVFIRNIRSNHIGNFVSVLGVIKQKSGVKPKVIGAKFECPSCGNILSVKQEETTFTSPTKCSCGRKGKFNLLDKELIDAQRVQIEESYETLDGGSQPKRMNAFLINDLASPWTDQRINAGTKVEINGVIREVPIPTRSGTPSTTFELQLDANYIAPLEDDFLEIKIDENELEQIKLLSKDPDIYTKLRASIAPSIYGHDLIKDALVLQMFGGVRKVRDDGVVTRGDTHTLLIGDPGTGKCSSGDTKVILDDGSINNFEELSRNKKFNCDFSPISQGIMSFDLDAKSKPLNASKLWKRKCHEKMFLLKTSSGRELKLTEDHPLFTTVGGIVYGKPFSELKKGDFIAIPRKLDVDGSLQIFPRNITRSKAHHKITLKIPDILNKDIARLFAYIIAEGYVTYTSSSGDVRFNNNDLNLVEDFKKTITKYFKIPTHTRNKGNTEEIYVTCKEFVYFLESLDPRFLLKSQGKGIPKIIQRSPNHILKEFLSALFECDGYAGKKGEISYCSKSRDLIDELQLLLLRFEIHSIIRTKMKCATNTVNKIKREYYELILYGENASKFVERINFISERKRNMVSIKKSRNTNIDVVPGVSKILKLLREQYKLTQFDFSIPRTTYQHYERGDRLPSREKLQKISNKYMEIDPDNTFIQSLFKISHSDIFWDRIEEIKETPSEEYVYDFEVPTTHNFVANGVMVHNSQLIKRISKVAPKAYYVSGKGATGAGLCVAPDTLISFNPGEIDTIKDVVESRILKNQIEFRPGIYKEKIRGRSKRIYGVGENLKVNSLRIEDFWRLKSPRKILHLTTQSGKKVSLTKKTKLLTIREGSPIWIESGELKEGDYLATPRKIPDPNKNTFLLNLIDSNPNVLNVKNIVKNLLKNQNKRELAKKLDVSESNLYYNWVRDDKYGQIPLKILKELARVSKHNLEAKLEEKIYLSHYNGKRFTIPKYANKDFMYFLGLIAGDGDLSKSENTVSIRLSNKSEFMITEFVRLSQKLFGLKCNITEGNEKRPKAARFASKVISEICNSMGIPNSPKSHRIDPSNNLIQLNNKLISSFLSGLFDCDGSVVKRKTKGSSYIDLTTVSPNLAKKLQLLLIRFEIYSKIRIRPPTKGKIKGKYDKYVLEIRGKNNLERFKEKINFKHPEKASKLKYIIPEKGNTNIDLIPGAVYLIRKIKEEVDISHLNKIFRVRSFTSGKYQISRKNTQRFVEALKDIDSPSIKILRKLAYSDIFWDKIVMKEIEDSPYSYVYDFTVNTDHSFIANGIFVHNTATVLRDEFTNSWILEAGSLVLANKGYLMIDEMDKMNKEDRDAMHEGLEQQSISISKANVQATLRCETTVLAAANPKFGRFDPYLTIAEQIDMPPSLINRFDLIFPVKDLPNKETDKHMAGFILRLHQGHADHKIEVPISTEILRKYIAYARQTSFPKLIDAAVDVILEEYVKIRNAGGDDGGVKSVPISSRQLEGIIRLSEASARVRLSNTVDVEDAKRAIDLVMHCLMEIAVDKETGRIDIDKISSGITASARGKIVMVKEIIMDLEDKIGKVIPIDDIIKEAEQKGITPEKVEEAIEKLKRSGDIFEPKVNFISRL